MSLALEEDTIYSNFINSLRSVRTKKVYDMTLKQFMKFHDIGTFSSLLLTRDIEEKIKEYILDMVNREISTSYMNLSLASLRNFFQMNDIENIKWHKLKRFMGEKTPNHEDRRYTHEEIQTLLNASDLRLKVAMLLMSSSGLRLGALPTLLMKHLQKINSIPVYKISVYKGLKGKGQYYTFCTPECASAIDTYLQFRERCGEKITGDSPLLRKDFDSSFHESARNMVYAATYDSIRIDVYTCLINTGLRTVDHVNSSRTRKDVKMTHGFRKFYESMLVNTGIHETIIRKLTGHSNTSNLTQLYSKQTEEEMLAEYSKAINNLTINPENRLKRKIETLETRQDEILLMKLNHDKEIKSLREDVQSEMKQQISELISKLKPEMVLKALS